MYFNPGSEAVLAIDYVGTSLRRGQRVIIIACRTTTVLAEVLNSEDGEHIISIPKAMLIPKIAGQGDDKND